MIALVKAFPQKEFVVEGLLIPALTNIYEQELKWKKNIWIAKCMTGEEKNLSEFLLKT